MQIQKTVHQSPFPSSEALLVQAGVAAQLTRLPGIQATGLFLYLRDSLGAWSNQPQRRQAVPVAAVQRLLHRFRRRHGMPEFVILHDSVRSSALSPCLSLHGLKLLIFDSPCIESNRARGLNIAKALFGRRASPIDRFCLLLNPRNLRQASLDEMDCFDTWSAQSRRWSWSAADTSADRLAHIVREWRAATAPASDTPPRLPSSTLGVDWVGVRESEHLRETIRKKTLFRHYGIDQPRQAETLERELRRRLTTPYALAVSSGSAALNCALAALDLNPGDEVVLPAFSWFSCYNAIIHFGATPIFAEIDATLNLDPEDLRRRLTTRTRAVIVVHYQGGPAKIDEILALTRVRGIKLVEDCAQAIGGSHRGRPLGSIGDIGTFSFQSNKIISSGEGGALVCRDQKLFERAVRYHDLGMIRPVFQAQLDGKPVTSAFPGNQYRMSEPAAAIALAQLSRLDWILRHCRKHARQLRALLRKSCPDLSFRLTGDAAGDNGITLFIDWLSPARLATATAHLRSLGIPIGPSSGMTNLLETDYVRARAQVHGIARRDWPPAPPTVAAYPQTCMWLARYMPLAMSPRYRSGDVPRIAEALIGACRKIARENHAG